MEFTLDCLQGLSISLVLAQLTDLFNLYERSLTQVQETNRKAIEYECKVLSQHRKEQDAIFRKQTQLMADIVSRGKVFGCHNGFSTSLHQ